MDEHYGRMRDDTEAKDPTWVESQVKSYFAGKNVFFTGATGFMGKVFVEKMLRECQDIGKLYLLVRQKKGVPPEEKVKKYFQNFIFDRLRKAHPGFEKKIVTIRGDLQEDRLGLSDEDRKTLIENVDVIVHNGATVKFDEIISVALKINVMATKHMLDLAMDCKRVKSFTYVSTAYSHCYIKDIEEKFYDSPGDLKLVEKMIEMDSKTPGGLPEEELNKILGKWPNIYCFTKSIAEDLVRQYGERANFGCAVYRPSIVSAAYKEPLPGWVGNNNGPAYIFMGVGLGIVHAVYYKGAPMDLVPVDYSINSLIASVYDLPDRWQKEKKAVVYNYGSSTQTPIRLDDMFRYMKEETPNVGSTKILWHSFMYFTTWKITFYILHVLFHFFPALLADAALLCLGQKPRALSMFWFATKHLSKVNYFANGDWRIHSKATLAAFDKLNTTDQKLFNCDLRNFDWQDLVANYIRGVRVYILKEPLDNIEEAKRHLNRLRIAHKSLIVVLYLIGAYYALMILTRVFNNIF